MVVFDLKCLSKSFLLTLAIASVKIQGASLFLQLLLLHTIGNITYLIVGMLIQMLLWKVEEFCYMVFSYALYMTMLI